MFRSHPSNSFRIAQSKHKTTGWIVWELTKVNETITLFDVELQSQLAIGIDYFYDR